jgi:acetate kinase
MMVSTSVSSKVQTVPYHIILHRNEIRMAMGFFLLIKLFHFSLIPDKPQVAVFDTGFYRTMPAASFRYAIPEEWFQNFKVRRYGFHGISHSFVVKETEKILGSRFDIKQV